MTMTTTVSMTRAALEVRRRTLYQLLTLICDVGTVKRLLWGQSRTDGPVQPNGKGGNVWVDKGILTEKGISRALGLIVQKITTFHEARHVRDSSFDAIKNVKNQRQGNILNIVEDKRIDNINITKFPGLIDDYTVSHEVHFKNAAKLLRSAKGHSMPEVARLMVAITFKIITGHDLRDELSEKAKKCFDEVIPVLTDASVQNHTQKCLPFVEKVDEIITHYFPNMPQDIDFSKLVPRGADPDANGKGKTSDITKTVDGEKKKMFVRMAQDEGKELEGDDEEPTDDDDDVEIVEVEIQEGQPGDGQDGQESDDGSEGEGPGDGQDGEESEGQDGSGGQDGQDGEEESEEGQGQGGSGGDGKESDDDQSDDDAQDGQGGSGDDDGDDDNTDSDGQDGSGSGDDGDSDGSGSQDGREGEDGSDTDGGDGNTSDSSSNDTKSGAGSYGGGEEDYNITDDPDEPEVEKTTTEDLIKKLMEDKEDEVQGQLDQEAIDEKTEQDRIDAEDAIDGVVLEQSDKWTPLRTSTQRQKTFRLRTNTERPDRYDEVIDRVRSMVVPTAAKLKRLIKAKEQKVNFRGNQTRGKLNMKGLQKAAVYNPRIFQKKDVPGKLSIAVTLLLDRSGSMGDYDGDEETIQSIEATVLLAEVMNQLGINFEVAQFGFRRGTVTHWIPKPFGADYDRRKFYVVDDPDGGNNDDGASVDFAMHRLMEQPEQKKLLIVVSDGHPVAFGVNDAVKCLHLALDKWGHESIVGVGICGSPVDQFYKNFVKIQDIEELPEGLLGIIQKTVLAQVA